MLFENDNTIYNDQLEVQIKKALDEWKAAENYLNSTTDPELVEYAIFDLEAARRKYAYMLKKLRQDMSKRENG